MPLYTDLSVPWPDQPTPIPSDLGLPAPGTYDGSSFAARPTRNYGDILYWMPELAGLRTYPGEEAPSVEFGDAAPVSRTLLRRLVGAAAEPLGRVSAQLDALPLRADPAFADGEFARFLLRTVGFPVVEGAPDLAVGRWLRDLHRLLPVGTTEGYLRLAEAAFGRGTRTYSEDGLVTVRSTATPGGVTLRVVERLPTPAYARGMSLLVSGAPEWFLRQLHTYRNAYFAPTIVQDTPGDQQWND